MIQFQKIGLVAKREFLTTVTSKGFLFGLLIMPLLIVVFIVLVPRILNGRTAPVQGEMAVMDGTGRVTGLLRAALDPAAMKARAETSARNRGGQPTPGTPPVLTLLERPSSADVQKEKNWLTTGTKEARHIALVVIHPDAVVRGEGNSEFGTYDLYVSTGVSDNTETSIHNSLRQALVDARLQASGLDLATVETTMLVKRPTAVIVGAKGEQAARRGLNRALPFICGILLFMGVFTGGQTLMTSTVEEKSSRVVEVLLAALSPLELMWGKLLGQLGVGLLVMAVYIALGLLGLAQFAMLGLLDPLLVVYLIVFFLVSYLVFGALMMAIGAAVNQMAEAQSLMGPIMLLLITPYVLTPIIGQAPNSPFSVAVSFIPPVNPFAMLARMASDSPPPAWQPPLSVLVGIVTAIVCVWFAAKIFRIGLLMHGKPPNFATMIRWARMA
jgi:ABC-2 type transport system permease protein